MSKTYLNPSALFPSQQYGFSQGVATVGKTTVYVSGQVGWNAAQQITDPADLGTQTRQALENLEIAVREALLGFFPAENLPTSTWIGVSALGSKDFLIEIEAVAVLE